ncbi:cAMP-binding domain of CRP or a regulatory subunit of cAMP-dependent protein kinases [Paucidesulfovibrio gracilis DSM 16080]|uniref:cAMP-binding domain of CRP or a regulatory subunit of cAMP-dependent protein kinases n=1 Tax=Paucidesulfovibrio gracilis DSM 16080 TaxID=1121449 RepID=A0A1T4W5I0_9BACT|nr:Crp/Fnr family transcriptional regulator [Paucidesulfovibrio gracilis]SKA72574.1 cAMP-binding domain of CRP or a regulatory subunit of cAMP-dependent protein kinases [Paucidesulfovibrio gracilis DSM 16080]
MHDKSIQQRIDTLRKDINLNRATPSALEELARNARSRSFDKGQYVFRTGDTANLYYLVESGRVVLSRESPSGKAFTFLLAERGTPLNAVACFKERTRFFSARVLERAELLSIPCRTFRDWVQANPDVAIGIINTMGDLLDGAYTRILGMIDGSAEERILNALSMLSSRIGPDLPLTNADVAELVGTSRETAARIVSRLQECGLVRKTRGTIRIIDKSSMDSASTSPFFII